MRSFIIVGYVQQIIDGGGDLPKMPILNRVKLINLVLFLLKSSENPRFSHDFRESNRLIRINSPIVRSEVWLRFLPKYSTKNWQ